MHVAELMTPAVTSIDPESTIAEAVQLMADQHFSALPATDHAGHLIGVLSTTDIVRALAEAANGTERNHLFEDTPVKDLMTSRPATVQMTAEVKEAAQLMMYLEVHRLYVLDDEKLVGVISSSDLGRSIALSRV
jgi:CBS domain-containing protein